MSPPDRVDEGSPEEFAIHGGDPSAELADCHVDLHADGSVVLVVDGEPLFRFASFDELLTHYELTKGTRSEATPASARAELEAAEISAAAHLAAVHLRPRAEKTLADDGLVHAIRRVRRARAHVASLPDEET